MRQFGDDGCVVARVRSRILFYLAGEYLTAAHIESVRYQHVV